MEWNETRQSNVAIQEISDYSIVNTDSIDGSADGPVNYYGKLMKQSLMNSFNINDEFIESTTVPDSNDNSMAVMTIVLLCKCFIIGFIILAAIFGNMLVIVSVMQHRKLR